MILHVGVPQASALLLLKLEIGHFFSETKEQYSEYYWLIKVSMVRVREKQSILCSNTRFHGA